MSSFLASMFKQQTAGSLQIKMSSIHLNLTVEVIWIPTRLREQVLEKLLVVDARHTADLCCLGLSSRVSVDEVGCDADSQLASQLLVLKA